MGLVITSPRVCGVLCVFLSCGFGVCCWVSRFGWFWRLWPSWRVRFAVGLGLVVCELVVCERWLRDFVAALIAALDGVSFVFCDCVADFVCGYFVWVGWVWFSLVV